MLPAEAAVPILKRKNGWTKIRSGGLEGWLKDDYLVFGDDIKPLAKELGLYIATVSTQTLHVREEASTDSAIVGLAAAEDYYPVLSQETGWVKIQLSVDTSGYVSSDYVTISVKPGRAISIEAEMAALEAAFGRSLLKKLSRHPEPPRRVELRPQDRGQKQTRLKVPPRLRENLEILEALRKRARLHQPLNHPT
ncbi:MAG: SH3 domain-containing protein [Clostridium fessum]